MAASKGNNPLTLICHPFLFALKEGKGIKQNLLDYSLLLLQRNCAEVIKSPTAKTKDLSAAISRPFVAPEKRSTRSRAPRKTQT